MNALVDTLQKRIAELETENLELKRTLHREGNARYVMALDHDRFRQRIHHLESRLHALVIADP